MACVNNQYFEFHEMQLDWSIYRTKMVWINWLIGRADVALSILFNMWFQQQLQLFLLP